jgi:outer membrane lipoprotein-sorting protein
MPRKRHTRQKALAVGLACLALLAGCTTVPGSTLTDADAVGDRVETRYDAIDRYEATVTKTVQTNRGTSSVRARVTVETDDFARVEYRTGPRAGTVTTTDLSSASATAATVSTGVRAATDGGVPTYGALAAELVRSNDVTVERTTILDGRRTAVVSLVPADGANATRHGADGTGAADVTETSDGTNESATSVERRVWVDTERLIPLRVETTWTGANGEAVTETVTYSDVTLVEDGENHSAAGTEPTAETGGIGA